MCHAEIDPYLITIWFANARLSLSDVIKRTIINKFCESPEGVVALLTAFRGLFESLVTVA